MAGPHPSVVKDAFFHRYGWDWQVYGGTPEWLLEELVQVMLGEAEGVRMGPAVSAGSSYPADMRSAADIARLGGLPPPPSGWSANSSDEVADG